MYIESSWDFHISLIPGRYDLGRPQTANPLNCSSCTESIELFLGEVIRPSTPTSMPLKWTQLSWWRKVEWKCFCTSINLSSSLAFTNTQEHILRVVTGTTQPISDQHIIRHCEMDEELLRRRNIVREKYALLRAEHPALPPVLRDFQVQGAFMRMSYIISVFR